MLIVSLLAAGLAAMTTVVTAAPRLDEMAIIVTADHPREFIFTDKGAAHLAGEAVGPDTRSYHGFYVAMHEVVDGWTLRLADGTVLGPATITSAEVTPDRLVRHHDLPTGGSVTETVELFDRENGFKVSYEGVPDGEFAFQPRLDMRFLWKVGRPDYEVRWGNGTLLACRRDALAAAPDPAHPAWLAVAVAGTDRFTPVGRHLDVVYPKGQARKAMDRTSPYLPGDMIGRIPPQVPVGRVEAYFAADVTAEAAAVRVRRLRSGQIELRDVRRERLQILVNESAVTTGVQRDDIALAWARVSLDNLIMNQRGPGLYAGFYWFTTYWGRDTFIALPGACIVNGDFATAETLLRSFAEFQDTDPASPRQGRVPNFVTVDQVQYASIDGTWWFVRALDELWRQSGDDELAAAMAPIVYRAIDGALAHAVDADGFLTHGDGETWMDGGGEANPFSPRGNRAVEVQTLWHRGLLTAARLAARFPQAPGARSDYTGMADRLARNFHARFWDGERLVDHLNLDGSQDQQLRPNALLAVLASPSLFDAAQRQAVTGAAARELVRPWGVLSLAAADPNFHPKHLDLARYNYDEAYHNGDIWLWLSGSYVSALNSPPDGFDQTRMLLDEALDEGAVGTIQEIRDGAQAPDNDEFGGATSQAWSLAELLRNTVQDYAGLRVDLTASPPVVEIRPSVPAEWPALAVQTRIGRHACLLVPAPTDGDGPGLWFRESVPPEWELRWVLPGQASRRGLLKPDPQAPVGWSERVVWQ
jgi:glycogen debranching enzyme